MDNSSISFYLKYSRIHVFIDMLRGLGCPKFICFLIDDGGNKLLVTPYTFKDFHSHRVPKDVYNGFKGMDLTSLGLCRILAALHHWEDGCSYRVPGRVDPERRIALFDLDRAVRID